MFAGKGKSPFVIVRIGLLLFLTATLQAAGPVCRTPLGVPCHLIRYELSQWLLFQNGWTDIRHTTAKDVLAVRGDGSAYWSHSVNGSEQRGFYRAATDEVVTLFPANHTYSSSSPMIWHGRPFRRSRDGDPTCSTGILHNGTDFRLDAQPLTMLGVRVVHWSRSQGNGGWEDIYLAPEIDCAPLKHVQVLKNSLHLPRFISIREATTLQFGEPPADLFVVPATYAEIPDPYAPALQRFVNRNKR